MLEELAAFYGISVSLFIILIIIMVWDGVWKLIALWKSARKKQLVWFILLAIINSAGILSILYIFIFSKMKLGKKQVKKTKRKK